MLGMCISLNHGIRRSSLGSDCRLLVGDRRARTRRATIIAAQADKAGALAHATDGVPANVDPRAQVRRVPDAVPEIRQAPVDPPKSNDAVLVITPSRPSWLPAAGERLADDGRAAAGTYVKVQPPPGAPFLPSRGGRSGQHDVVVRSLHFLYGREVAEEPPIAVFVAGHAARVFGRPVRVVRLQA